MSPELYALAKFGKLDEIKSKFPRISLESNINELIALTLENDYTDCYLNNTEKWMAPAHYNRRMMNNWLLNNFSFNKHYVLEKCIFWGNLTLVKRIINKMLLYNTQHFIDLANINNRYLIKNYLKTIQIRNEVICRTIIYVSFISLIIIWITQ